MSTLPPAPPSLEEVFNTPPDKLPRNKTTETVHKRETWLQIYLPLWIGLIAVVAAGILVGVAVGSGDTTATRVWADVSLVFVILQVIVVVFPLLIVFIGLAYGINHLIKVLPPYAKVAQDYTALAARKTEWALQYVVEPVLKTKAGVAGLDKFIQGARKFFKQ